MVILLYLLVKLPKSICMDINIFNVFMQDLNLVVC